MAIGSFLQRIFGRARTESPEPAAESAIDGRELEVFQPLPRKSIDGDQVLVQFHNQLISQAESQQQLNTLLGTLTMTLNALPQLARQQGQVLETLMEGAARARLRDQAMERSLVQLSDGSERQTHVLGLVQQQLDLNHEVSLRVAESLRDTAGALSTFAATSDRQARALENLAQATQRRVAQSDRLEKALQFWLAIVAVICTLALLYAIWAAMHGPLVVVIPPTEQPTPAIVTPPPAVVPPAVVPSPAVVPPAVAPAPAVVQPAVVPLPAVVQPAVAPSPAVVQPVVAPSPAVVPLPAVVPPPVTPLARLGAGSACEFRESTQHFDS